MNTNEVFKNIKITGKRLLPDYADMIEYTAYCIVAFYSRFGINVKIKTDIIKNARGGNPYIKIKIKFPDKTILTQSCPGYESKTMLENKLCAYAFNYAYQHIKVEEI